jgi:uncharacterized protein (UPF0218 family)
VTLTELIDNLTQARNEYGGATEVVIRTNQNLLHNSKYTVVTVQGEDRTVQIVPGHRTN